MANQSARTVWIILEIEMLTLEKRQIKFSIVLTLKMHSRCVFKLLQRSDEKPCLSWRTTPFHGKVKTDDFTPRCKVAWTSPLANFTTKTRSVTPSRNDGTADNAFVWLLMRSKWAIPYMGYQKQLFQRTLHHPPEWLLLFWSGTLLLCWQVLHLLGYDKITFQHLQ